MLNVLLIVIVVFVAFALLFSFLNKRKKQEAEDTLEVDDKTYTLEK